MQAGEIEWDAALEKFVYAEGGEEFDHVKQGEGSDSDEGMDSEEESKQEEKLWIN